ncbi:hypothetical protein V8C86DRAFT_2728775, partial [Haematococcus lacustris]
MVRQPMCMMLWSLARMGVTPSPSVMGPLLETLGQQLGGAAPHELASAVHALAVMRHQPGSAWMITFFRASHPKLPGFTPPQLGALLLGLARLRVRPEGAWMEDLLQVLC